jgi:two-component system, OmpR family, response regulator RegX3
MSGHRIVIVEDDPIGAKVLRFILEDEGYNTVVVPRGSQVFVEVVGRETDLVILDVSLPDIDGFAVCKELRARRYRGPIVFLTSRTDISSKVLGFQIGADDYIVKPYEPLELVARVQSVIRRFKSTDLQSQGTIISVDDAVLSIGELLYTSKIVAPTLLTPTEMKILECLMRNNGIVISRNTLIERVWGYDFVGETNRVDVYIRRVRRKIENGLNYPRYLHTVRGIGYVFRVDYGPVAAGVEHGYVDTKDGLYMLEPVDCAYANG